MERPYIQNPFPPPPRRIGASLLFFGMAAMALAGCGYLIYMLVVPESSSTLSSPVPNAAAQSEIATLAAQMGIFRRSVGRYPKVEEGLEALTERPAGMAPELLWPKLRTNVPRDPWGNAYVYEEVPGEPPTYRIYSKGSNSTDPADDISQTLPAALEEDAPVSAPAGVPKFR